MWILLSIILFIIIILCSAGLALTEGENVGKHHNFYISAIVTSSIWFGICIAHLTW